MLNWQDTQQAHFSRPQHTDAARTIRISTSISLFCCSRFKKVNNEYILCSVFCITFWILTWSRWRRWQVGAKRKIVLDGSTSDFFKKNLWKNQERDCTCLSGYEALWGPQKPSKWGRAIIIKCIWRRTESSVACLHLGCNPSSYRTMGQLLIPSGSLKKSTRITWNCEGLRRVSGIFWGHRS